MGLCADAKLDKVAIGEVVERECVTALSRGRFAENHKRCNEREQHAWRIVGFSRSTAWQRKRIN
jgi:hypothetical protein